MKRALIAIALVGCRPHAVEPAQPDPAATIRTVAAEYTAWGKVDDQARAAPAMCAAPAAPTELRRSAATEGPHDAKLYYLYTNDRAAYLNQRAGVGFRVVKESFAADGGAATGLFVMAKVGTPDSDAGWIYGTTAPDGTVTSAGRVATCMGCHEDAPGDRLFGLRSVD